MLDIQKLYVAYELKREVNIIRHVIYIRSSGIGTLSHSRTNSLSVPGGSVYFSQGSADDQPFVACKGAVLRSHSSRYYSDVTHNFVSCVDWCTSVFQWDGEVGEWPTPLWKEWTRVASCPPYDGHDDQLEYSQYKVQI